MIFQKTKKQKNVMEQPTKVFVTMTNDFEKSLIL